MAILGEIPRVGGFLHTSGTFSYASQHPWVFASSVRENIVFGADFDRRRYNKVIQACSLLQVESLVAKSFLLESLVAKRLTFIILLSGGLH